MKRRQLLLSILFASLCCSPLALTSCIFTFNKASDETTHPLCGAYTEQRELTDEDIALFRNLIKDTSFTPLSVATQVVAGLNYCFRCNFDDGSGNPPCLYFVTIYQPLQGEPIILKIQDEDGRCQNGLSQ